MAGTSGTKKKMVFGLFESPLPYKGQKYADLKKQAVESGHPFIDSEFPPDEKALSPTPGKFSGIIWKRPGDICDNPKLFVEGASSNDICQGILGNCWFVAAASCLAENKQIWEKVIPNHSDQEWDEEHKEKYGGIFHFRFWRYGEWLDVVIDDFLPTRNGELVFVKSKASNEFWSALLEKAYAKLFGCYEVLDGGELSEALEDFTSGVAEPIDLVEGKYFEDEVKREELFKVMKHEIKYKALMAAAIPAKSNDEFEQAIDVGLVKGHAYGITAVKRVAIAGSGLFNLFNRDKLAMIRLRNPWGGTEWNGAFSDGSKEWNRIDAADREKIGLVCDEDGEFWMTCEDFCKYFTNMSICRVVNTSFFNLQKTWHEGLMHSEWGPQRQGGCINNKDTFLQNPQYKFDITSKVEDETLMSVMQKSGRTKVDDEKLTIGFTIIKVEENRDYRIHRLLQQEIIKSSVFKNSRGIFMRLKLKPGRYIMVPCTFEPNIKGSFLLRVYTGSANHGKELVLEKPKQTMSPCFPCLMCKYPQLVTRIRILRATGLEKQDRSGGADPYCIISNEGHKVTSKVISDTINPDWNIAAIFYRRAPINKGIKVEIWNSNPLRDDFMGEHIFETSEECDGKLVSVNLFGRKNESTVQRPGKLFVEMTTSRNLLLL